MLMFFLIYKFMHIKFVYLVISLMMMIYLYIFMMKNVHSMVLGIMLSLYVVFISMKMNFYYLNYWYTYMLYLCMIGGLMILFMYFMSIIINNKMMFTNNMFMYMMLLMILLFFIFKDLLFVILKYDDFKNMFYMTYSFYHNYKNLFMYTDFDKILFLVIYLLFMMIVSIMICMKKLVPMRKLN